MRDRVSLVYGLARKPVSVVGDVNLTLDLGGGQIVTHTFEVLSETGTTIILGRDLLRRFHSTEFDWGKHKVRLGNTWKESQATVEGGDSLLRAEIACLEVAYCEDVCMASTTTKSDLDRHQMISLTNS